MVMPHLLFQSAMAMVLAMFLLGAVNGDAGDHVNAYKALQEEKIVPLTSILDWVERRYKGYVVEIELESNRSPLTYEVEFITDKGIFLEFLFDATNGKLLKINGRPPIEAR